MKYDDTMDIEIVGGRKRKRSSIGGKKRRKKRTTPKRSSRRRTRRTKKPSIQTTATQAALIGAGLLVAGQALKYNSERELPMDKKTLLAIIGAGGVIALTQMKLSPKTKRTFEPIALGAIGFSMASLVSEMMSATNTEGTSGLAGSYNDWSYRNTGGIAFSLPQNTPDIVNAIV
ncbi:MAG: hypothetical protein DRH24_15985 [Deltaproteobacteria bacterium]|nr:MAG: hypothetical protein DRH24_15985 [Deltaproteobacteria bacterium]